MDNVVLVRLQYTWDDLDQWYEEEERDTGRKDGSDEYWDDEDEVSIAAWSIDDHPGRFKVAGPSYLMLFLVPGPRLDIGDIIETTPLGDGTSTTASRSRRALRRRRRGPVGSLLPDPDAEGLSVELELETLRVGLGKVFPLLARILGRTNLSTRRDMDAVAQLLLKMGL